MKLKTLPFLAVFFVATAFVVGCGDQKDPRLSDADIAYMKQQRLAQMYGGTSATGSTATSTVMQYVTITNTTTVNH
jgi:hypothetical protein